LGRVKVVCYIVIFLVLIIISTSFEKDAEAGELGSRTLYYGMQGSDVLQLQKYLGFLGYKVGALDGIFGWRTLQTVKYYQWRNGLVVDGIVGPQTVSTIFKQINAANQSNIIKNRTETKVSRSSLQALQGISRRDWQYLAQLVYSEARGEPFIGQVAVAAVVLNRLESPFFPNTIPGVIFQPGAFTAVSDGQFWMTPNTTAHKAVEAALKGWDPTYGALYYYNPAQTTNNWIWSRPVLTAIGNHIFAI